MFSYIEKNDGDNTPITHALFTLVNTKMLTGYSWTFYIKSPFIKKIKLMTASSPSDFTYVNNMYSLSIRNPLGNGIFPRFYYNKHIIPQKNKIY